MTWFSTWPSATGPAYKPHDTESDAERHAAEVVRSGTARQATVFEIDGLEACS